MSKTVRDLRESFLKFFEERNHRRVRSSSLVPQNDPTLLFTNAGMVQFKDFFTGKEKPSFTRATTVQKCVRAGGKHNDLEIVGFTKRHHTFFEMLGNFSFGDYFKEEAIEFAWTYLTKVVGFPKEKLWVSVYKDDQEAADLWKKISGLSDNRIARMGEADNFWAMGDTGPCGPCTEIYYDRGESLGKNVTIYDGGERYLEVWNNVFMQFERFSDGRMIPLPKPSVDTGMGLERLASLVQGVDSNYDIDGMQKIVKAFCEITGAQYGKEEATSAALKVLTDHLRACSFLIADGVNPSNEGRGYVLRRILRRAIRYGKKLGAEKPFFHKAVNTLVSEMSAAYPELSTNEAAVTKMIQLEEEKFFETLEGGLKLLDSRLSKLASGGTLEGALAFQLYDTFGFPLDLTEVILRERGFQLDAQGFQVALEEQRERSRASWKGSGQKTVEEVYHQAASLAQGAEFTGYASVAEPARILALISGGKLVDQVHEGEDAEIILDRTPFYAESGGQVGDSGTIKLGEAFFEVLDCKKPIGSFHIHLGRVRHGSLKRGDAVEAAIDFVRRKRIRINHTMTHVLHATLQEVVGGHIKQAGSLVTDQYLRFDFSHYQALTREELLKIENICNQRIRENPAIQIKEEGLEEALASGAKAFFEDKYGDRVRVLRVGKFSTELCGGTHAESLAEAGLFKIVSESSIASGVRRITAVTAQKALDLVAEEQAMLEQIAETLKTPRKELLSKVEKLLKERSDLQKKISDRAQAPAKDLKSLIEAIDQVPVLVDIVQVENAKDLRPLAENYRNQVGRGVAIVGAEIEGKATVIVAVNAEIAALFQTQTLITKIGELLGGKGGGKPDFAQVGGPNIEALNLDNLKKAAREHIQGLKLTA
jgi:alanyl-tRNA synthetase